MMIWPNTVLLHFYRKQNNTQKKTQHNWRDQKIEFLLRRYKTSKITRGWKKKIVHRTNNDSLVHTTLIIWIISHLLWSHPATSTFWNYWTIFAKTFFYDREIVLFQLNLFLIKNNVQFTGKFTFSLQTWAQINLREREREKVINLSCLDANYNLTSLDGTIQE